MAESKIREKKAASEDSSARDETGSYDTVDRAKKVDDMAKEKDKATDTDSDTCVFGDFEKVEYEDVEKEERVVLIIGKTGNGKSTLGNILLGANKFEVGRGMASTTVESQRLSVDDVPGRYCTLKVVDTPDINNMELDDKNKADKVAEWKKLSEPGPHVILLAVRCDVRYTAEEYDIYREVKRLWDDDKNFSKRLVVGFTFGDRLDREIAEELESVCPELKNVLKDADNRYVVFNNRGDTDKDQQREGALSKGVCPQPKNVPEDADNSRLGTDEKEGQSEGALSKDLTKQPAMKGYLFSFMPYLIEPITGWIWDTYSWLWNYLFETLGTYWSSSAVKQAEETEDSTAQRPVETTTRPENMEKETDATSPQMEPLT